MITVFQFMHSADDKPRKEEFNKVDWALGRTPHVSYNSLLLNTFYVDTLPSIVTIACVLLLLFHMASLL